MALKPDDTVCYCFHVSRRKIETFCAVEKPQHASQISECLSAGSGCGWCVPIIEHIHKHCCGQQAPWWRAQETPAAGAQEVREPEDADSYLAGRKQYLKEGKGTPPAGAET